MVEILPRIREAMGLTLNGERERERESERERERERETTEGDV